MATISSTKSGLSTDTTVWSGGVVPVVGDKVNILHPGTNVRNGTLYSTPAAAAAGVQSLVLTGGTGTIVVGECVRILNPVTTDSEGTPVYDPTYYQVTTGITASGQTLQFTPGLAYPITSSVSVENCGHVVTVAGTHTWGDDTSSLTPASNAIVVSGTLKASRAVTSSLTCRGTIYLNDNGTLDYGIPNVDHIPSNISATLRLNDSASMATGKHGIVSIDRRGTVFSAAGEVRSRNTRLKFATAANAMSFEVESAVGWAVGHALVIASATDNQNGAQVVNISGIAGNVITPSAPVAVARNAGCRVGLLSSNVTFASVNPALPGFISILSGTTDDSRSRHHGSDFTLDHLGSASAWNGPATAGSLHVGALNMQGPAIQYPRVFERYASVSYTAGSTARGTVNTYQAGIATHIHKDAAFHVPLSNLGVVLVYAGSATNFEAIGYACGTAVGITSSFSEGASGATIKGEYWAVLSYAAYTAVNLTFENAILHSSDASRFAQGASANVKFIGGALYQTEGQRLWQTTIPGTISNVEYSGTMFSNLDSTALALTAGVAGSPLTTIKLTSVNGVDTDNRVMNYYITAVTDTAVRKRGSFSVKIAPNNITASKYQYRFKIPALAGVAQKLKGSIRVNVDYGLTSMPVLKLSGQGVSQSFAVPAVADAWNDFELTVNPTNTGDIDAVLEFARPSGVTTALVWLDGIYHYPMISAVRHYGYQWLPQAAQIADTRVTLTEAVALALPVTVNHGTQTVTINGNVSANQLWHALVADLCKTENITRAEHMTLNADGSVSTSYNVVVAGGAISGAVNAANGKSATLILGGLNSTTVMVINDTNGVAYEGVVTGTFEYPVPFGSTGVWTWVVKRPGYRHSVGTFMPGNGGVVSLTPSTPMITTPDGQPMFTNASSPLVTVDIAMEAEILIGDGMASLQGTFDSTELALISTNGMRWLAGGGDGCSLFNSAGGDYLFMSTGWRLKRANVLDGNAGINAFAVSADGQPIDDSNGPVIILTSDSPSAIAQAVRAAILSDITGIAAQVWEVAVTGNKTAGTMGSAMQDTSARVAAGL